MILDSEKPRGSARGDRNFRGFASKPIIFGPYLDQFGSKLNENKPKVFGFRFGEIYPWPKSECVTTGTAGTTAFSRLY